MTNARKMVDVDGRELSVGDRVQMSPGTAPKWQGPVVGSGAMGQVLIDIGGVVTSFSPNSIRKLVDVETGQCPCCGAKNAL